MAINETDKNAATAEDDAVNSASEAESEAPQENATEEPKTLGKPSVNKKTVRRIIASFKPYRAKMIWIILMVLASVGFGLMPPFFLRIIIDQGISKSNLQVTAQYSLLTLLFTVLASVLTFGYGYLSVSVGQDILQSLRNQLFSHLQGMSLKFFSGTRTGEIQSRLLSDVGGVQSVVSDVVANAISNIGAVLASLFGMIFLDWRLTIVSVAVIPLFGFASSKAGLFARDIRKQTQEKTADLNSITQETLSVSGILLTRTSGRRDAIQSRFASENRALSRLMVLNQAVQYFFFGLVRLVFAAVPALVFWVAALITAHNFGVITVGTLVAFTSLQARMFFPLTQLLSVQVEVVSSLALFDRIYEYLDRPKDIEDSPGAIEVSPSDIQGRVEFSKVNFAYTADEPTIKEVSFEAEPGTLIALVGPSGSGKTTLTYLLARLYDVESGSIRIDGHDVRDLKQSSLEPLIGAVTQETYLIHATIAENLRFAKPEATTEELVAACKAAAIHDHIDSLPDGYDTVVGERGYKLSGGEKQRVALARAILKNPRILILDEATSALDTKSERYIQQSLNDLMRGRTTLAIAHRLSTIVEADLILVLKDGEIVERGTHERLLAQKGLYEALYREQFSSSLEITY